MTVDDRREFQRLKLLKPILALIDGQSALILDIGVAGAFVEHYGTFQAGDRFQLTFRWQGEDVDFLCEVARSMVIRTPGGDGESLVSHTGVRFAEGDVASQQRLQEMMATFVGKILSAQRANASGAPDSQGEAVLARLGEAHRSRSRGFLTYRLRDGKWWHLPSDNGRQPQDGFTVAAYEDPDELETLCRTYEASDEEGRRLIRLVAELSALNVRRV